MCVALAREYGTPMGFCGFVLFQPPVAPSGRPGATNMEPLRGSLRAVTSDK